MKNDFIKLHNSDKIFIDSLLAFLGENKKINILDVCCGTGKYACYLFSKGHNVTGIDISKTAIKNASAMQPNINYICDDILTFNGYSHKFDLILVSGPSF